MSMRYTILIGEFSVAQANALSDGVFLSAIPPLTAWVGLAEAIGFRLGKDFIINGVAPVVGESTLHRGHAKYVRHRAGQISISSDRGIQHPTIDDRRTSLNAYLLLDVTSEDVFDHDVIKRALVGLRLAGGAIYPSLGRTEIQVKVFQSSDQKSSQQRALSYLPSCFYLIEDASYLVMLAKEDINGLQGFDILTAPMQRWSGDETESEIKKHLHLPDRPSWLPLKGNGFYRPMAVGYHLLEAPQQRTGTRNDLRHSFAEPVFTLIRFRTVASIRKATTSRSASRYFWKQGVRAKNVLGACPVSTPKKSIF